MAEQEERQLTTPGNEIMGDLIAAWQFPEYIEYKRGLLWYVIAIAVILGLLAYALFTDNRLFMIIIILSTVIFVIANSRKPEIIQFAIAEGGIIIKDKFIPYIDINNFWIIYQPPFVKTLYFEPRALLSPRIQVHLTDQNPSEVRELLLQFLDEDLEKEEEPQSEAWGRVFRL
jgi:hypothetical protein